jgi:hypothetical protein
MEVCNRSAHSLAPAPDDSFNRRGVSLSLRECGILDFFSRRIAIGGLFLVEISR